MEIRGEMKFSEALFKASKKLLKAASSKTKSRLEAEAIMISVMGSTREKLYMALGEEVPARIMDKFKKDVQKRAKRFPLQLLTGNEMFYGRNFTVKKGVLIPRQDSEALIDAVLSRKVEISCAVAADIGSGSGILAITLLKEIPGLSKFYCFDISAKALDLTGINAELHGVKDRIVSIKGDFLTLTARLSLKFDFIVSNPPYIKNSGLKALQKEVSYDPKNALTDGSDGYSFYREFAFLCPALLKPNGFMAVEIGNKMGLGVKKIFLSAGWKFLSSFSDTSCRERALVFIPPEKSV
jgi:release factor glutamine methyltransferase